MYRNHKAATFSLAARVSKWKEVCDLKIAVLKALELQSVRKGFGDRRHQDSFSIFWDFIYSKSEKSELSTQYHIYKLIKALF